MTPTSTRSPCAACDLSIQTQACTPRFEMSAEPDAELERVLRALLEGYRAREGMKEKWRALSEYEIARRVGVTQYTYAGFDASPERIELRSMLDRLLRQGLVEISGSSGRYDTFAPVEREEQQ